MIGITDVQRREVRNTARTILDKPYNHSVQACELASFVLDNVDAPDRELSEELRHIAEHWEEWTTNTITAKLNAATGCAKQMEHDLVGALDKVERLTVDRDEAYKTRDARDDEMDRLRADVARLTAEVKTLAAENSDLRNSFTAVQKGAESNTESIDPADVKPGEAWIVECRGERRNAVKDNDDLNEPWNTVNADGWLLAEDDEDITLVSRLVPAPRAITNPDELDALPVGTILRDEDGDAWHRITDQWTSTVESITFTSRAVLRRGPVTVLWEPEA